MRIVILDLDGTLIDSTKRHVVLLKDLLLKNGYANYDISDYMNYKRDGNSTKSFLKNRLMLPDAISDSIAEQWTGLIESNKYLQLDSLYDDSFDFLSFLKQRRYDIFFLTARKNESYIKSFVADSVLGNFDAKLIIVNPKDAKSEKSCIIQNYKSEIAAVIGDSEVDYAAAKDNQTHFFMLNRGFRSRQFWAQHSVTSYDSLVQIKEAMNDTPC